MARLASCIAAFLILLTAQTEAAGPRRIVSLYPGHSENIVALGAGDRLVALSKSDEADLLPHLPRLSPKVGGEALLALSPDLVVVRSLVLQLNPAMETTLRRGGVPLLCLDPPLWDDFDAYLRTLAQVLAVDADEAVAKAGRIRLSLAEEARSRRGENPRPRVFLEATKKGLHTCSPSSWAAHLIALAEGDNVVREPETTRAIMAWGIEKLLREADSGLDVYLVQQGPMNGATREEVRLRPWMKALPHARVEVIDEGRLSRPSLLGLERGGKELIEIFYPREGSLHE